MRKDVLFITDLDGTLLNDNKEVSEASRQILNGLCEKGLKLAVSTARTPATAAEILKGLNVSYPLCAMNGAAIYDLSKEEYVKYYAIEEETVLGLIEICRRYGLSPFIHCVRDNRLYVCYENTESEAAESFVKERSGLMRKTYIKGSYSPFFGDAVYFSVLGEEAKARRIFEAVRTSPFNERVSLNFYRDVYNEGFYFLEIAEKEASKETGVKFLKALSGAEYVYAFGDNLNDLPMLKAADRRFAVKNAADEVKTYCDKIIEDNNSDGVALTIKQIWEE